MLNWVKKKFTVSKSVHSFDNKHILSATLVFQACAWHRAVESRASESSLPSPLLPSNGLNYSPLAFSCLVFQVQISERHLIRLCFKASYITGLGQVQSGPTMGHKQLTVVPQSEPWLFPEKGKLGSMSIWYSHKQGSWWQASLIASFMEISAWFLTWNESCFHGTGQSPVPRLQIQSQELGKKGYELSQCRQ